MNKLNCFIGSYYVGFVAIVFLISCGGGKTDKKVAKTESDTTVKVEPAQAAGQPVGSQSTRYLDILWQTSNEFMKLKTNKRLVLKFAVDTGNHLVLHGWTRLKDGEHGQYNPKSNFWLVAGPATTTDYGPGTFLGNQILDDSAVDSIQQVLSGDSNLSYVIFEPEKKNGEVYYTISCDHNLPTSTFKKGLTVPTNTQTNPSPPKGN